MKLATIFAVLTVVLTGCVTAEPMMLPSGQQGISVQCGGEFLSWPDCYSKATESCPSGYDVVKESREVAQSAAVFADDDGLFGSSSDDVDRWLLIQCKR